MRNAFACILIALSVLPLRTQGQEPATPLPAPPTPPPFSAATAREIDEIALTEVHSGSTPGLAIGVVEDGLLVYSRGFGFADLKKHVRVSAATQFFAGSIAKQFTAGAILLLAQDKKIDLSDKVTKYVPDLTIAKGITIAQLLQQTSGLPDYTQAPGVNHDPTKPIKIEDLLKAVNQMKPVSAPGSTILV